MSLMTTAQQVAFLISGALANWMGIRNLYYLVAMSFILIAIVGYGYKRASRVAESSAPSA